jgi:hypothetical protein
MSKTATHKGHLPNAETMVQMNAAMTKKPMTESMASPYRRLAWMTSSVCAT